ncbi:hypothetical protein [Leptospira interrogans]|uniref:hypothetical protein n=1 Tax=Leptospira interrogans TaxID=173 RepID=UPI00051A1909|nr:hypothetical protein [Leptospira interrogans]KAA1293768.1 hypothetical protein C4X99_01425 [Leptospira interrogans serovar Geyaweera]MCH1886499.1 hypothetical protein [Leptospira interrogans]MCH1892767.1 hypothetical protein [Leptospira interrogans]MCH1899611.1 hypothetical protein [Leptospira interrogans]MCH1902943.1 hypothetical protein [Leptospira interrogans]
MNKDFVDELNSELSSKGLPEVKTGSQTQLKTCSSCGRGATVLYKLGRCRTCITTGYKNRYLPPNRIKFF